jgi:hypothetical protein
MGSGNDFAKAENRRWSESRSRHQTLKKRDAFHRNSLVKTNGCYPYSSHIAAGLDKPSVICSTEGHRALFALKPSGQGMNHLIFWFSPITPAGVPVMAALTAATT